MEIPHDPVKASLTIISNFNSVFVDECVNKEGRKIKGDAIARRLQEFPQLALQVGLVPALTFYLSKIDNQEKINAYNASINAIMSKSSNKYICEKASGEGGGYPQALAIILAYAGIIAGCSNDQLVNIGQKLVECIDGIQKKGVTVEALTITYSDEIKKIARALYHEE